MYRDIETLEAIAREKSTLIRVCFLTKRGQSVIYVDGLDREFKKSLRFDCGDGDTFTIKKNDILDIRLAVPGDD